jgi:hypothetical protein
MHLKLFILIIHDICTLNYMGLSGAAIGTYRPQYRPLSAVRYLDANPLPTRYTLFSTLAMTEYSFSILASIRAMNPTFLLREGCKMHMIESKLLSRIHTSVLNIFYLLLFKYGRSFSFSSKDTENRVASETFSRQLCMVFLPKLQPI